jgi:putative SOS response-associated peptidase YedK
MCGRYSLDKDMEDLIIRYKAVNKASEYSPKSEIFPAEKALAVLEFNEREIRSLKWGFPTNFSKRPLINARSETIDEKDTFKDAFFNRRCIIPVDSYYEWQEVNGKKIKRRISLGDTSIFSLAGLYNIYTLGQEKYLSFVIITTAANEKIANIHDRMPSILEKEAEDIWLNPKEGNINVLKDILTSFNGDFIVS